MQNENYQTEAEVVKMMTSWPAGTWFTFTNPQGHEMRAKRSKHNVHVRLANTNVRATSTYNLPRTRTVEMKQGDYSKMSAAQLRDECKSRGLKVSGTKAEMNARLIEDDARGEEE